MNNEKPHCLACSNRSSATFGDGNIFLSNSEKLVRIMHTTFSATRRNSGVPGTPLSQQLGETSIPWGFARFSAPRRNSGVPGTPLSQKLGETQMHCGHYFLRNSEKLNCIMDTTFTRHLVKLLFIHFGQVTFNCSIWTTKLLKTLTLKSERPRASIFG